MKKSIGIDCSKLNTDYKTGTHRFLIGLLTELVKNDEYNYFFYVNKNSEFLNQYAFSKKGKIVCLNYPFLYTQVGLLSSLKNHDYFIFPWQTLPIFGFYSKCKRLSIIHDLGYNLTSKVTTFLTQVLSNRIFSVSTSTARSLFRKSIVLGEGVDPKIFYPIPAPELKIKMKITDIPNFYILSVGRVEKRKNVYNNIKAFARLKKFYPNIKYLFISNYIENEEKIYSLIRELGINDGDILFKKNVSDSDLNVYLNAMEFLVFTSLEEGFGLPVLEAYSVQKPVLLSKIEQLAEFKISANQYVDPNNVDEISERMVRFLKKDHGIESKKSYKEVLDRFSWRRCAETLLKGLK
jgi:glycosyltransferase involved in cell wall biosynthesis